MTVEAIADAAGVSPRTFFNYFSSKEDAIVGIAPAQSSALLADLLARPEDEPPLGALRAVVLAAAERLQAGGDDWVIRHRLIQKHHSWPSRVPPGSPRSSGAWPRRSPAGPAWTRASMSTRVGRERDDRGPAGRHRRLAGAWAGGSARDPDRRRVRRAGARASAPPTVGSRAV